MSLPRYTVSSQGPGLRCRMEPFIPPLLSLAPEEGWIRFFGTNRERIGVRWCALLMLPSQSAVLSSLTLPDLYVRTLVSQCQPSVGGFRVFSKSVFPKGGRGPGELRKDLPWGVGSSKMPCAAFHGPPNRCVRVVPAWVWGDVSNVGILVGNCPALNPRNLCTSPFPIDGGRLGRDEGLTFLAWVADCPIPLDSGSRPE